MNEKPFMEEKRRVIEKGLGVAKGSMKKVSDKFINEAYNKLLDKDSDEK